MSVFRFKKFVICDDGASMKLGTDAVLLGAWASINGVNKILDVGAGCGIIAIMLAQRSPDNTQIDGVELLEPDAMQGALNVAQSPWPGKVNLIHADIRAFDPGFRYDLIVSNPPYFTKSLLPPAQGRRIARHDGSLDSDELLQAVIRLITPTGKFNVILPASEAIAFANKAKGVKLNLHRHTKFFTRLTKPQERSLMEFGFTDTPCTEDVLTLYEEKEQTSIGYRQLTGDFYLDKPL